MSGDPLLWLRHHRLRLSWRRSVRLSWYPRQGLLCHRPHLSGCVRHRLRVAFYPRHRPNRGIRSIRTTMGLITVDTVRTTIAVDKI